MSQKIINVIIHENSTKLKLSGLQGLLPPYVNVKLFRQGKPISQLIKEEPIDIYIRGHVNKETDRFLGSFNLNLSAIPDIEFVRKNYPVAKIIVFKSELDRNKALKRGADDYISRSGKSMEESLASKIMEYL